MTTVGTNWIPTIPAYQPVEAASFAAKRAAAREALQKAVPPSDKKYSNWVKLQLAGQLADKDIGGLAPAFEIEQADYDTGLKTIAIPLSKAIHDWPVQVEPYLGQILSPENHYFAALSQSLCMEGAAVVVPPKVKAKVTVRFGAESGKLSAYRTILVVGAGAEVTYVEQLDDAATAETVVAHGVEVFVGANAQVDFYGVQQWSPQTTYLAAYRGKVARDARLDWLLGQFGAGVSQVHVQSTLADHGATSNVHSVFATGDSQHLDQTLLAQHAAGHTTSDTYTRGVVRDTARTVYRGMIDIMPGAHGSVADQNGKAMLLSDTARADMIPGLEIDADDVIAGHGATVGEVDAEQLFYLMARGIPEPQAKQMIVDAFFADLLAPIKDPEVRELFQTALAG